MFRRSGSKSSPEGYFSRELIKPGKKDGELFSHTIDTGRVHTRIFISERSSIDYELVEPYISDTMADIVDGLKERIVSNISSRSRNGGSPDVEQFIIETLDRSSLEPSGKKIAYYYLHRDFMGYGRIDGLLKDPYIEDISCDGAHVPVFVFHSSYGFIPTNVQFASEDELNTFIRNIVQITGKNISISSPLVDSILPDGSRIQASLGRYITTNGPSFTIRKFRELPFSPVDLIRNGTATPGIFAYLWILTEYGSNLMITGGTASGKTTFLNSVLLFAPSDKKVVSIEDTREINLFHENWLSTVTRAGFGSREERQKYGEIDMFDLLMSSLRHRPDYVVIGEVRGRETFAVFQAMSVGRYSYCTFHADDVDTLIHRLESNPIRIPRNLIPSLDTVVVLSGQQSEGKDRRKVSSVSELTGIDQDTGEIVINRFYSLNIQDGTYTSSLFSYALERIARRTGQSLRDLENEHSIRAELLERLAQEGITRFDEVSAIVRRYHRDRRSVLEKFSIR